MQCYTNFCVFQAEGENVSKLEKADILELTVRHLHRLRRPRDAVEDAHRFQASAFRPRGTRPSGQPNFTESDKFEDPRQNNEERFLGYITTHFNCTGLIKYLRMLGRI